VRRPQHAPPEGPHAPEGEGRGGHPPPGGRHHPRRGHRLAEGLRDPRDLHAWRLHARHRRLRPDARAGAARRDRGRSAGVRKVLVFEADRHLFAVLAEEVQRVVPVSGDLPAGTRVVDAVGLLAGTARASGAARSPGCTIVRRPSTGSAPAVAIPATRAREVTLLDTEKLLPLPAFLFQGTNPFLGVAAVAGSAIFFLAEPERLLAATAIP